MANWHTIETIRAAWNDADQIEDALLEELLEVARDAVVAYAPALAVDAVGVPTSYRLGQMIQVKNLWNASRIGASGDLGGDTFDWHVKQILRPAHGVPKVG
jgi:hypothetical protein